MTRGRIYAGMVALTAAVLAGGLVGYVNQSCDHTCPLRGPCPGPPGCNAGFYWSHALVVGTITFLLVLAVGLATVSALQADR